jgi:signal transduction histidine kinase
MHIFIAISAIFNGFVSVIAGFLVYFKNKHHIINKTFATFCFFVAFWAFGYFFPLVTYSKELSLLSFQLLHAGALFVAPAHFHFVCALLGITKEKKMIIILGYLINIFFLFTVPTRFFIEEMVPKYDFAYWANVGLAYHIWLTVWLGYVVYSVYLLINSYLKNKGIKKNQIKYILIGDIITFSCGSMNYFLFYDINLPPYFNILVSGQIITFAYVIIRYRFLDIQLNLINTLQKVFSVIFAITVAYFVYGFIFPFTGELPTTIIIGVSLITILFLSFKHLLRLPSIYHILRLTSFKEFKENIEEFLNKNIFYKNLTEFQNTIQETFCEKLKISSATILPITDKEKYPKLISHFRKDKTFLVADELKMKQENENIKFDFLSELESLGEICFPLFREKNLIGFFILGQKPYQNSYSKEELIVLEHAAHYISLSLVITLYNQELQKEIDHKTEKLQKQNKKMQQMIYQQAEFITVTTHELRTPINVAMIAMEMLKTEFKDKKYLHRTQQGLSAILKLRGLVQTLFEVQRLDRKRSKPEMEEVEANEFFTTIYNDTKPLMEEEKCEFKFENKLASKKIKFTCDPTQIRQVVNNLLTNATKFIDDGAKGKITLRVEGNDKRIFFSISDNGCGVPDETKKNIFGKFRSNHETKGKGLGLGLYLCKKIVSIHKGKIWCEDNPTGKGTSFCVELLE